MSSRRPSLDPNRPLSPRIRALGPAAGLAAVAATWVLSTASAPPCDPSTDPQCEDATMGHITGRALPAGATAAGARAQAVRRVPEAADALGAVRAAIADRVTSGPAVAKKGARRISVGRANDAVSQPRPNETWRPGEIIVRGTRPVRQAKGAFRDLLVDALKAGLPDTFAGASATLSLCNTETMCLLKLKADGKPLDPLTTRMAAQHLNDTVKDVAYAEVNRVLGIQRVPNDPLFRHQWHYGAMDLERAWDISTGHSDVVAAVIDTGLLAAHPELSGRIVGSADLIDDADVAGDGDGRDSDGEDVGDQACGASCHSHHGSHVAGTMAAATNNASQVAGVAWDGQLLGVRALGRGGGSTFDIVGGVYWAIGSDVDGVPVNPRPADVINMSLGGRGDSQAMNEAIAAAAAQNTIVVVAAGNDAGDAAEYTPANAPDAITVAAVSHTGPSRTQVRRATYSNTGSVVDVAAPGGETGEDVDSDGNPDGVLSTTGNFVTWYQGTSMAAPHVAGVAMLMKDLDPNIGAAAAKARLKEGSSSDVDCTGCGAGVVSAARTLIAMQGGAAGPDLVPAQSTVRAGKDVTSTRIGFKNLGGAAASATLTVAGADASAVQLEQDTLNVPVGGTRLLDVTLDRTGSDEGWADVTAHFADGDASTVRLEWSGKILERVGLVMVGAVRYEGDQVTVERIVETRDVANFDYKLFNLRPGAYRVIALTDDNADGTFADGEGVGFFPDLTTDGLLNVTASATLTGADLTITPAFSADDPTGTGDAPLGAGCRSTADCAAGLLCEAGLPGGYCMADCSADPDSCPAGSACFCYGDDPDCGVARCFATCDAPSDCRESEGYTCDADNTCYVQ